MYPPNTHPTSWNLEDCLNNFWCKVRQIKIPSQLHGPLITRDFVFICIPLMSKKKTSISWDALVPDKSTFISPCYYFIYHALFLIYMSSIDVPFKTVWRWVSITKAHFLGPVHRFPGDNETVFTRRRYTSRLVSMAGKESCHVRICLMSGYNIILCLMSLKHNMMWLHIIILIS